MNFAGDKRPTLAVTKDGGDLSLPVFTKDEAVRGYVTCVMSAGKKVEHLGIKAVLLGLVGNRCRLGSPYLNSIELSFDRGNSSEFTSSSMELSPAGTIENNQVCYSIGV